VKAMFCTKLCRNQNQKKEKAQNAMLEISTNAPNKTIFFQIQGAAITNSEVNVL